MVCRCFLTLIWVTFILVSSFGQTIETDHLKPFYDACANGDIETVEKYIDSNPELAKSSTTDGETCLHLSAISKSHHIAKLMIQMGADVNQRVTHQNGLRMTPLSWHVYGGNYDIVKLLISHGAEINADFDYSLESSLKITATDIASNLWRKDESDDFTRTLDLLISKGGKKYADMQ